MTGVREWTPPRPAVPLEDTGGKTTGRSGPGSLGPAHPRLGWPVAAVHATYGQGAGLSVPLTVRPPQRERPLTIVGPTCALYHILRAGTRERERSGRPVGRWQRTKKPPPNQKTNRQRRLELGALTARI